MKIKLVSAGCILTVLLGIGLIDNPSVLTKIVLSAISFIPLFLLTRKIENVPDVIKLEISESDIKETSYFDEDNAITRALQRAGFKNLKSDIIGVHNEKGKYFFNIDNSNYEQLNFITKHLYFEQPQSLLYFLKKDKIY